jgi:hypothetical protein
MKGFLQQTSKASGRRYDQRHFGLGDGHDRNLKLATTEWRCTRSEASSAAI